MKFAKKWMLIVNLIGLGMVNNAFAEAPESFCDQFQPKNNPSWAKLDTTEFRKHQIDRKRSFTIENGIQVLQVDYPESDFYVEITHPDHAYQCHFFYDRAGRLVSSSMSIYEDKVGKMLDYDQQGNITDQLDIEEDYEVNIVELIDIMKRKFNVDVLNKNQIKTFDRLYDITETLADSYYEIFAYADDSKLALNGYLIDATTGELLYLKENFPLEVYEKEWPRLFDMYLASRQPQ